MSSNILDNNILILYAEVMPYNIPVFQNIIRAGYSIYIVQLEHAKLTPYEISKVENISVRGISEFTNYGDFRQYCININPRLVLVSEVMNIWYWKIAKYLKKNSTIPIALGSDAQWMGTRNNWIKKISFKFTYNICFTHILIAGLWQCEYARKIGFKKKQILSPLYSADIDLYHSVSLEQKKINYPKRFLYFGRLHPNKGILLLFEAWKQIYDKKGWSLTVVGNGPLKEYALQQKDIEILDFQSQDKICELMSQTGCVIVPSIFEPWGVVVHEAVAGGMPIIATTACGATNEFVINKYNGYIIPGGSLKELVSAMEKVIESTHEDLLMKAIHSRELSFRITPQIAAYSLLSLIED